MTRRKLQPTADAMREQLALAAEEIIRLRTALAQWEGEAVAVLWRTPAPSGIRSWGEVLAAMVRSARAAWRSRR